MFIRHRDLQDVRTSKTHNVALVYRRSVRQVSDSAGEILHAAATFTKK